MKTNEEAFWDHVNSILRPRPDGLRPCGDHCGDCGEHDSACDAREEAARNDGRAMTRSAEQLYDHALIDAGPAGQSFARILAAVFRGDAVPALLIAQAREEFAEGVLDYLMKGSK